MDSVDMDISILWARLQFHKLFLCCHLIKYPCGSVVGAVAPQACAQSWKVRA